MKSQWKFRLNRAKNISAVIFKSKMAAAGILILAIFIFLALAAPIITPYDPENTRVSGSLAQPAWYTYFSEGARLSQNFDLEPRTGFTSDPFNNQWQFTEISPPSDNHLTAAYAPGINAQGSGGSIGITLDRSSSPPNGTYTGRLEKTFDWKYNSAPYSIVGSFSILTPTASQAEPVRVTVYIKNVSTGEVYNLTDNTAGSNVSWGQYPFNSSSTSWLRPSDLGGAATRIVLHSSSIGLEPAAEIFPGPGQYAYGAIVSLTNAQPSTQPLKVFVDRVNLQLLGTAWGLMGTDYLGRDVFTQLVYGARISLLVGLLAAGVGIAVGLVVGLAAGYMGKLVDEVLMRFTDMLLVLPTLPLIIILVAVTAGRSTITILILILGLLGWMGFARVVRSQVLTLKERPFVEAAKAAGGGTAYITTRHIIPNIVGLIYVNLALAVPGAILSEAALSFLGLGDPTVVSWGKMLNLVEDNSAQTAWWWILPPGLAIALVSLSFVMVGFALDSIFNPRLRQRR